MIVLGIVLSLALIAVLAWIIVGSFFSHRHWRRVIAGGDEATLLAALEEALYTWRTMRPPREVPPADWAGLQSAAIVACDLERCRLSVVVGPDVRVREGRREEVGPAMEVAERVAVRMVERVLYEIPLCRFDAVQVDAYVEYRSPDGHVETDCLLTTQTVRNEAAVTDWDESTDRAILETWATRWMAPAAPVDPDREALIARAEHIGLRVRSPQPPEMRADDQHGPGEHGPDEQRPGEQHPPDDQQRAAAP